MSDWSWSRHGRMGHSWGKAVELCPDLPAAPGFPGGEVHGAGVGAEDIGEGAECLIAGLVTGAVVVFLEVVEVEEHDSESAAASRGGKFLLQEHLEVAPVGQTGE